MPIDREQYFNTLGISENGCSDDRAKLKLEKALDRAYALRTFEIEYYWKRATYFWGFQIAIFAAFGLILNKDPSLTCVGVIAVALSILGILTAVANYLSTRGSRFWQENWEKHIDMLEDEIEGRLYKTVWLKDGRVEFSVSRINAKIGIFLIVFWFFATVWSVYEFTKTSPPTCHLDIPSPYLIWAVVIAVTVVGVLCLWCQRSDLHGTKPNNDGGHGKEFKQRRFWSFWERKTTPKPDEFIRRYAPYED